MSRQRSSWKRRSILQGVYEENLRIERGEPSPRREGPAEEEAPPPGVPHRASPAAPPRSVPQWMAVLLAVLALGAAGAAAYWAGGTQRLQEQFSEESFSDGASPVRVEAPFTLPGDPFPEISLLVDDSLRGRALPFRPLSGDAAGGASSLAPFAGEAPRMQPLGGGDSLSVASVFGLEVKTVVIDPGHGGKKDGAIGPNGTREKHVALDVARRLRRRLERRYDYRVLMTRTGDEHRSLRERVAFANRHHADLFISLHVNSLPVERVRSIETYYYGAQASDPVLRLARRENRASGYSVSDFDALLEEVGRTMRRQESRRLAASIQKNLYRNMKEINREVRDWGVKTAPFVVLLGVKAPSVLAEIAVISNAKEEQELRSPAHREKLARFLEEGIAAYLGADVPAREHRAAAPPSR